MCAATAVLTLTAVPTMQFPPDLNALLDSLGAQKVHVLGMSQGARVALQFARRYPARVASLIIQGAPAPDGFGLPWSGADRPRLQRSHP